MPAKIINLIGGPNTGKTCTALGLSYFMKRAGLRVKYVQEYAEDMVYEDRNNILADQLYILAKQNRRLHRLREITDYVITDSPLILGKVYSKNGGSQEFRDLLNTYWDSYDNVTFYHPRDTSFAFHQQGRIQSDHEECLQIDRLIMRYLPGAAVELQLGENYVGQIVKHLDLKIDLSGPADPFDMRALSYLRKIPE
jgi:hypothetical protein